MSSTTGTGDRRCHKHYNISTCCVCDACRLAGAVCWASASAIAAAPAVVLTEQSRCMRLPFIHAYRPLSLSSVYPSSSVPQNGARRISHAWHWASYVLDS